MEEWLPVPGWIAVPVKKKIVVPSEKMSRLFVDTPDEGGKLGKAIEANLMRLVQYSEDKDIFAAPKLTINSPDVPDFAGGAHSIGTGEFSQGSPSIELPPSASGTVYLRPKELVKVSEKTIRMKLTVKEAAIFLHEVNHAIHRFVNQGRYLHPTSSDALGAVSQNLHMGIMSRHLQKDFNPIKGFVEKKANEMETYWLCCCDASKYHFSEEVITAIKVVNNQNLLAAKYERLANQKQADRLNSNLEDDKLWSKLYDIEKLDPRRPSPPSDDLFNDMGDDPKTEPTEQL